LFCHIYEALEGDMPELMVKLEHLGGQVVQLPVFIILDHIRCVLGGWSGTFQVKVCPYWLAVLLVVMVQPCVKASSIVVACHACVIIAHCLSGFCIDGVVQFVTGVETSFCAELGVFCESWRQVERGDMDLDCIFLLRPK
jgi:hypothetical protein